MTAWRSGRPAGRGPAWLVPVLLLALVFALGASFGVAAEPEEPDPIVLCGAWQRLNQCCNDGSPYGRVVKRTCSTQSGGTREQFGCNVADLCLSW